MSKIVDEAKKIFNGDLAITKKEYDRFIKSLERTKDIEKIELAKILLNKVCLQPNFITIKDLELFQSILPLWQLNNSLSSAICISECNYKKSAIFSDNQIAQKVADILNIVSKNEYMVISALLNNGFGDKDKLKKYIDLLDPKIFNCSPKLAKLYKKAIQFCTSD